MAEVIKMPRLSDTMEEGTVAKWLVKQGEKVKEGDILAEIETDKATMEFESFYEGILLYIGVEEGGSAPVDQLLAIIGEEKEDISGLIQANSSPVQNTVPPVQENSLENSEVTENNEIPEDVTLVTMPRLSDTMEEGTVATWLKKVGDPVAEGDILAEIETDKATMEFESFQQGILLHIGIQAGESAPVDTLLAIIGPKGTDISKLKNSRQTAQKEDKTSSVSAANASDSQLVSQSGNKQTHSASSSHSKRILASPLAKRIAADKGIDLGLLKGSGENGRIIKKDVEAYSSSNPLVSEGQTESRAAQKTLPIPQGETLTEGVKNSQMRKAIAKSLSNSKFSAPHYYLTIEVDMDIAIVARKQINAIPDTKVSFNDLVIKATAMALRMHPQVNTSWNKEATQYHQHIHIGVAVAVPDGLVVPVLPFADQMRMTQINAQVKTLAAKAKQKKLTPQEMSGSTFTVSNLGMFGIQEFTSIINQPNSAILSVGAILEKPVVKNNEITIGNTMKLTLACDHRTVDGATGAKFLQTLRQYLENPVTLLA